MRLHRLALFAALSAAFSAVLAVPIAFVQAIERGVAFAFKAVPPPVVVAGVVQTRRDDTSEAIAAGGPALAIQNSLRHEAGMRPLRC